MANRKIMNADVLRAIDSVSAQINEQMAQRKLNAKQVAHRAGVNRKVIYPLLHEPYKVPHFENLICILNALGMDEITIRWRD